MRVVVIDGVQYLSVRDMIGYVCDKDNNQACAVWRNLSPDKKEEVKHFLFTHKFPGPGQSEQPVITFPGALKLIMFLPGETAKKHRSAMARILLRYYAGDPSLIQEITDNACSSSPLNQLAQASLAAETEAGQLEDTRKRKREDLELVKLETEIRALDRTSQATLHNSQIALVDKYNQLCTNMVMDERARIIFKDSLLNLINAGRAITNGDNSDHALPISISQVASALGYHFDTKQLSQVGKIASGLYIRQHDKTPHKHTQLIEGRATEVNTYFESERELLEEACRIYSESEARKKRAAAEAAAEAEDRPLDRWLRPRN